MTTERYLKTATAEQLRDAAIACRHVFESGGNDDDWDSPRAEEARKRTADLGWAWDFTSWGEAAGILEREADLASHGETDVETLVCACQIQHDGSGQGHNWRNINADDIPANIRIEIECEIIDGGNETHTGYLASNGQHYRW